MQLKPVILATLISPSVPAVVFGIAAFFDAPDGLGIAIAMFGAAAIYFIALGIALVTLLPVYLLNTNGMLGLQTYALISGAAAIALFVAFSLFTGSFGPPRDWYWIPLAGLGLGACFSWMLRR